MPDINVVRVKLPQWLENYKRLREQQSFCTQQIRQLSATLRYERRNYGNDFVQGSLMRSLIDYRKSVDCRMSLTKKKRKMVFEDEKRRLTSDELKRSRTTLGHFTTNKPKPTLVSSKISGNIGLFDLRKAQFAGKQTHTGPKVKYRTTGDVYRPGNADRWRHNDLSRTDPVLPNIEVAPVISRTLPLVARTKVQKDWQQDKDRSNVSQWRVGRYTDVKQHR